MTTRLSISGAPRGRGGRVGNAWFKDKRNDLMSLRLDQQPTEFIDMLQQKLPFACQNRHRGFVRRPVITTLPCSHAILRLSRFDPASKAILFARCSEQSPYGGPCPGGVEKDAGSPPGRQLNELAQRECAASTTSASGCPSRSSTTAATTPRSTRRWPTRYRWRCSCCWRAFPRSSERSCCCTTCSTTTTRGSLRSSVRARTMSVSLAARARRDVEQRRPRFHASRAQQQALAQRFFAAPQNGDLAGLEALLAHDAVLIGDCGRKAPALARSLHGRSCVARALLKWVRLGIRVAEIRLRAAEVNGMPGTLVLDGAERLISVLVLEISRDEIQGISSIVNPDKLAHLGPTADLGSLVRGSNADTTDK